MSAIEHVTPGSCAVAGVPVVSIERHAMNGGIRIVAMFANGRGASIIKHSGSYGVELAVLDATGELDYSTPVTDDVLGWLDEEGLRDALMQISALPAAG